MIENYKPEIFNLSELNDWDDKISKSEQGTVFNTGFWAEILKDVFGVNNKVFCIVKNGNILGALPVFYKKRYGINVITQIPLTLYNGSLFFFDNEIKSQKREQYRSEMLESLITQIQKEFGFCNFSNHPSINDVRPFYWNKWEIIPQYTYRIALGDEEKMWENFSSSLRRKINHGDNECFIIKEENDPDNLINLHWESYSRKGMNTIIDRALMKKFIKKTLEKNIGKIFTISDNKGVITSSRAVLCWNNIVYDWIAGTSVKSKESNSTHFLLWKILQIYSRKGCRFFDFMGANTKKILDFKRSFGGELTTYYEVKHYSSKWIKMLTNINDYRHRLSR
jgi:hypothetical protein